MPETLDGDEWQQAEVNHFEGHSIATREQQQRFINQQYMDKRMTLEDWRLHTDLLSEGIV